MAPDLKYYGFGLLVVIGLLLLWSVESGVPSSPEKETQAMFDALSHSVSEYQRNTGTPPSSLTDLADPWTEDGWGNDVALEVIEGSKMQLRSAGPDGVMKTADDLIFLIQ